MPYNPLTDSQQIISKQHKQWLIQIAKRNKRTMRGQVELWIEENREQEK